MYKKPMVKGFKLFEYRTLPNNYFVEVAGKSVIFQLRKFPATSFGFPSKESLFGEIYGKFEVQGWPPCLIKESLLAGGFRNWSSVMSFQVTSHMFTFGGQSTSPQDLTVEYDSMVYLSAHCVGRRLESFRLRQ
jgi:hypothetical protein